MNIADRMKGRTMTLDLTGEVDLTGGPQLKSFVDDRTATIDSLILDMEKVTYVSSAGIRAILSIKKDLDQESKKLKIINCTAMVYEVFEITGLDEILDVEMM